MSKKNIYWQGIPIPYVKVPERASVFLGFSPKDHLHLHIDDALKLTKSVGMCRLGRDESGVYHLEPWIWEEGE